MKYTKKDAEVVWHCWNQMNTYLNEMFNVIVTSKDNLIINQDGKVFIDGISTLLNSNIGHGNKHVISAITKQLENMDNNTLFLTTNVPAIEFGKRICNLTENYFSHIFYTNSGSEANDTAIKLSRQYFYNKGVKGKYKVISFKGAYHGCTMGALSACGINNYYESFEPLLDGFIKVEPPELINKPEEISLDEYIDIKIVELEKLIIQENPSTIAAFIAEPIQLSNGVNVIPEGYWRKLSKMLKKYEIMWIADEVATGFGRTGKLFCLEYSGVWPDIMVLAKGITSGYIPMGAVLTTDEIYSQFLGDSFSGKEFVHGFTTSGHPVACAAAIANLDVIEESNLIENSRVMGEYLLTQLKPLEKFSFVKSIHGKGLMIGFRFKDEFANLNIMKKWSLSMIISNMLSKNGVIVFPDGAFTVFIAPPLTITNEQCTIIIGAFNKTFNLVQQLVSTKSTVI